MELTNKLAKKLGKGIIQNEEGNLISIMPSMLSQDFYEDFELRRVHPKRKMPLKIEFKSEDNVVAPHLSEPSTSVFVSYSNDSDFDIIGNLLTETDKKILAFIGRFRDVQHYHILKEFSKLASKKVESSLKRLNDYYLINFFEFNRDDMPGKIAKSYSIRRNGTYLLSYFQLISPEDRYKWANDFENTDRYQPIRFWKICDTYQTMKHTEGFKGFNSQVYFEPKPYVSEKERVIKNQIGQKKVKIERKEFYLQKFKVDGELIFHNDAGNFDYYFDLYPIINYSDVDNLIIGLQHFGLLEKEKGTNPNAKDRILVCIVDNWEVAEKIINHPKINLKNYSGNVLFLDLNRVRNEDMMGSLFYYSQEKGNRWTKFPLRLKNEYREG